MRPSIVVPERTPPDERRRLGEIADLHVFSETGPLLDSPGHVHLLVAGYGTQRTLEVAGQLEGRLDAIQVFSAGVDAIVDRVPHGVVLCDASGVHDVAVAEWVMMAILVSRRRLPEHLESQRAGTWESTARVGEDLQGAEVVIVGAGSIGRAVEARLRPFGARVTRVARHAREGVHAFSDLTAILPGADVMIVLLPLTNETRGSIGADVLAALRPGALVVNASRGAVMDTAALTDAVLRRGIRAALDVTDPEPLPTGHPLWSAPGVLITPHVASDVRGEDARAWQLVFEQVGRLSRGEPLANVVADGY